MEPTDIYFLNGFPKRGKHLTLFRTRPGGQSIASLRLEWWNNQNHEKGMEIKYISRPELMVIAFTVTILCGAAALHQATGSQMRMVIECFQGTIFNWCDAVLANLKGQQTRAKRGQLIWAFICELCPRESSNAGPPASYSSSWGRLGSLS